MAIFKYKNLTLNDAKNRLFVVWITGFVLCFVLTFVQSIMGKYDDRYIDVVNWFGPLIFPTLTLMIGVLIAGQNKKGEMDKTRADELLFKVAELCSLLYLAAIFLIFIIEPFLARTPFELMSIVKVFFTGFDGFLNGLIGYFFIKK